MISIVVAMDKNRVIGKDNQLPWHLPADLAFFKKVTMGKVIVMGRKTYESIGRPLPGRKNIILTKNKNYVVDGCNVIHSIDDIFTLEKTEAEEICVIGGAEIFNEVLTSVDRLYITLIDDEFSGDTYFPALNESDWELVSKEKGPKDEKNRYDYYFTIYTRRLS